MQIERTLFGTDTNKEPVYAYLLKNKNGMIAEFISYGALIRCLHVPNAGGQAADVVLGYDDMAGYLADTCYFGATIGRIGNRIRNARFELDGKTYILAKNNGEHHLHGGYLGFHKQNWTGQILSDGVAFTRYSPDGEEGYPGGLMTTVTYRLLEDNSLVIDYLACADKKTIANLTNHSYFNLAGHETGSILDHKLQINARFYTPGDEGCVPTGEILCVKDTPMDFTSPKPIGRDIDADFIQLKQFNGYDHNYVLNAGTEKLREIAVAHDPKSGRRMHVYADLPGVQLYTGNFVDTTGKNSAQYGRHSAFCLETQYFPDAANQPHFEGPVLTPDKPFRSTTVYRFSW